VDTGQKTESIAALVKDIGAGSVGLPEFQRDFVWDIEKTFDLFDSFVRDIFVGSLIFGVPSFEITVRELDARPRSGKGSRTPLKLSNYTREQVDKQVKIDGFRLLLDGQQRATSIYRTMLGIDLVYFVSRHEAELSAEARAKQIGQRTLEDTLDDFQGQPAPGRVNVRLDDAYRVLLGEFSREKEKAVLFLKSNNIDGLTEENVESSSEFLTYLTQLKNLENLLRQEKLVAYYLLDTDEEKFALFFERSNSKGIQLNFIDILAAKLYAGFNLRAKVEEFERDHPGVELNREVVVRAIAYKVGRNVNRAYILSQLNADHFKDSWNEYVEIYRKVLDFLQTSRLLIHANWLPFENMLLPLMAFGSAIKNTDFSQISADQARALRVWYWLAIFSRRYSSAAQTFALEDAQALQKVAVGDFAQISSIVSAIKPVVGDPDDLLVVHKKYDSVYKGVLNLVNFSTGGFLNWENNNPVSLVNNLEDHHIFPKDYLRKNWSKLGNALDPDIAIDCVVNRTLIPKLTNIRVSNKTPSAYLAEIRKKNSDLATALSSHAISEQLASGDYDREYDYFLAERAEAILQAIKVHILDERRTLLSKYGMDEKPQLPELVGN